MVRRTSNRRGGGRRQTNVSNRRINRAVRIARSAPLARVRARPVVRGQATSAASINGLRRMTMFPKKLPNAGKADPWWIEGLKWIGITAMKLLVTALTDEALQRHLQQHPLPDNHPLTGKYLAASVPTGCITMLAFDYSALLAETDFVKSKQDTEIAQCHYRQARLEWIKITIHPVAHPNNRGGMIAAAILPISMRQFQDDFAVRDVEARDFNELLKTPGVVYKTATTATNLVFSPKPSDEVYNWGVFGVQAPNKSPLNAVVYLHVGLTNLSSDASTTTEYALTHSMLDITIESRIHLREYDEDLSCPLNPVQLLNAKDSVTWCEYNKRHNVKINKLFEHHGLVLRAVETSDFEMSP